MPNRIHYLMCIVIILLAGTMLCIAVKEFAQAAAALLLHLIHLIY